LTEVNGNGMQIACHKKLPSYSLPSVSTDGAKVNGNEVQIAYHQQAFKKQSIIGLLFL